jgi:hypothetical protein
VTTGERFADLIANNVNAPATSDDDDLQAFATVQKQFALQLHHTTVNAYPNQRTWSNGGVTLVKDEHAFRE